MGQTGRILTQHPEGRAGGNIEQHKYEAMRTAILETLRARGPLRFKELTVAVKDQLQGKFDGSVSWYLTTVKLDLEARGEVICNRKAGGQMVELVS
ncbi:DUF6958 family protein [Maritalea mediterranea]|uniref:Uncharacterized protein n=1 Tax=Maritalea mediterranea TaxID=2909667 RepID=A0ABS9E7D9_9HYPH|nr:hypothetical protein [Maritalea mediterranea]MCF4098794.1 hypothetical protein [Maritalea mediterranea]